MVKITGSVTPSEVHGSGTDEHAQVQELLNSASWQDRLEKARLKRLQVLADRGEPTARPSTPEGMNLPASDRARDLAAMSLRSQRGRHGDRPRPAKAAPEKPAPPTASLPAAQPALASSRSTAPAVSADAVVAKLHHARAAVIASLPPVELPQVPPPSREAALRAEIIGVDAIVRAEMPVADFVDLGARAKLRKRILAGVIGGAFAVGLGLGFGVKPFLPAAVPEPGAETVATAAPAIAVASSQPAAAVPPPTVAAVPPAAALAEPEAEPPQVTFALADADALAAQATAWSPLPSISHVVDLSTSTIPRPSVPAVPQADTVARAAEQTAILPAVLASAPARIAAVAPETPGAAPLAETALDPVLRNPPEPTAAMPAPEAAFLPPEPAPAAPVAPVILATISVFAPASLEDSALASVESDLSAAGHPAGRTTRVDFTVSATHVRYYHAEDAALARAVAADMGGRARDFTTSDSNSPPGTIELWLAGTSASTPKPAPPVKAHRAPKKTAAKAPAAAPKPAPPPMTKAQQVEALRSSLIERLKTADAP